MKRTNLTIEIELLGEGIKNPPTQQPKLTSGVVYFSAFLQLTSCKLAWESGFTESEATIHQSPFLLRHISNPVFALN